MYHTGNKHIIDTHDDTEVKKASVVKNEDGSHSLHVEYTLKPEGDYSDVRHIHSTNGVNHRVDEVTPHASEVVEKEVKKGK